MVSKVSISMPLVPARPIRDRFVFQLLLGMVAALVPPWLLLSVLRDASLTDVEITNSFVSSGAAFIVGLLLSRRMRDFPGITRFENELPIFLGSYLMVGVALLIFRMPYSSIFLVTSSTITMLSMFGIAAFMPRGRPAYCVVPFGNVHRLKAISGINLAYLDVPRFTRLGSIGVVADLRADLPPEWERLIAEYALAGIPVYHFKQLQESLTGQVDIEHLSENSLGSLLPNRAYAWLKSVFERIAALFAIPVLALPLAIVAIAIKLDSPGPVLFRQPRIGLGGRPFEVIKFRTMVDRQDRADERRASMTLSKDNRVTRLGVFLRRTRIDELPQLINVLRGEMSWIGPRPEALALADWYEEKLPFYSYRHIVLPGITGWAQVNQGHVSDLGAVHDKLRFDFYYIKNFSLWLDLLIVFRTIRTIFSGFGVK